MEAPDLAIKYKSKVYEALLVINNIKNIGFKNDADKLMDELSKIREGTKHEIKTNPIAGYEVMSYEQDYSKGINALNKFINKIENKYDVYVKVYNSCKSIDMKLQRNDISEDEFQKCISEIIYDMKIMVESGTLDYDDEAHIVSKLYDTVYNVIKLELIKTGESQVYLYATNRNANINIAYLSSLVAGDISSLDLTDEKNLRLLERLYDLGKNGVTSSYFDLEVIKLILISSDNVNFKKIIVANVDDIYKKVNDSYSAIERNMHLRKDTYNNLASSKGHVKTAKRNLSKRIGSLILALSLIGGGAVGINSGSKKLSNRQSYLKTTTTYSSLTDETLEETELVYGPGENTTNIKIYGPWHDKLIGSGKARQYWEYDVSNIDTELETPKDYYEYGVENFQVRGKYKKDTDDSNISLYDSEYTEVEIVKYTDNGEIFSKDSYGAMLFGFYFLYVLMLAMIVTFHGNDIIQSTKNRIAKLKNANKRYNAYVKELNSINSELLKEINKSEELRNKFNELYEQNKYLLDNPEELYNRVNDVIMVERINEAKKLVKNNKKGR